MGKNALGEYTVTFTERDVIGVWLGNADRSPIAHTGGGLPCNFIYNVQSNLQNGYNENGIRLNALPKPSGVVAINVDKYLYEHHNEIWLADQNSPAKYQMREWFKKSNVPKKVSEVFSSPKIVTPTVSITEFGVEIQLQPQPLYRYKIIRCSEEKETTVYDGEYIPVFLDKTVDSNKQYVYTVVPYYQNRVGNAIRLPTVNTHNKTFIQKEEKEILNKIWWEY